MGFESAINGRCNHISPTARAGELCASIMSELHNRREADETAAAFPGFWKNISEFEPYVQLHTVETRISRALLMLCCSEAYEWVALITTAAVRDRTTQNCWVDKLVKDIEGEWNHRNRNPQHPKEAVFDSRNYLPSLACPSEVTVELRRWGMIDRDEEELRIIHTASTIIETWLQFPTSKDNKSHDKLRCTLISILTRHLPLSILLLDAIWSMYQTPYQLLIHGRPKQRISRPHTAKTIKLFEESLQKHDMKNSKTKEYLILAVLTRQTESWFQRVTLRETRQIAPIYNVRQNLHDIE